MKNSVRCKLQATTLRTKVFVVECVWARDSAITLCFMRNAVMWRVLILLLALLPLPLQAKTVGIVCETQYIECTGYSECEWEAKWRAKNRDLNVIMKIWFSLSGNESPEFKPNYKEFYDVDYSNKMVREHDSAKFWVGESLEIDENFIRMFTKEEETIINRSTGYIQRYNLHTDGSFKDLRIGDAYSAHAGWCKKTKQKF